MYKYFVAIFGDQRRRPRPLIKTLLKLEALNARIVPCAGATGSAGGSAAEAVRQQFASDRAGFDESGGGHHGHGDCGAEHATLAASLSNSSGATGTARFSDTNGALNVSVTGAAASSTLNVTVTDNGTTTTVGTLTTDASGNGHAKFNNVTLAAGDTITVGDLNGTFAQATFTASLTGATGLSGSARFSSVNNRLGLRISGAAASTTYNVTINGTVVDQIITNSRGFGHARLTLSGVTIASGSTISIADTAGGAPILTGTFA
jgi:hypothetical protein